MKTIDLSHTIHPSMPVYPGTDPPVLEDPCTLEANGFREKKITIYSHTGTHVDAPSHLLEKGLSLDQLPIEQFIGKAVIIDCTGSKNIELPHLQKYKQQLAGAEFLILKTGWSRYWGTAAYFNRYPVLTAEAAGWLVEYDLKGIGVDAISFDAADCAILPIHSILLTKNILLVENLTNLESISADCFTFLCFPLKLLSADGCMVRAVAIEDL